MGSRSCAGCSARSDSARDPEAAARAGRLHDAEWGIVQVARDEARRRAPRAVGVLELAGIVPAVTASMSCADRNSSAPRPDREAPRIPLEPEVSPPRTSGDPMAIGIALFTLTFTLPAALEPAFAHHPYQGLASLAFCIVLACLAVTVPPALSLVRLVGRAAWERARPHLSPRRIYDRSAVRVRDHRLLRPVVGVRRGLRSPVNGSASREESP